MNQEDLFSVVRVWDERWDVKDADSVLAAMREGKGEERLRTLRAARWGLRQITFLDASQGEALALVPVAAIVFYRAVISDEGASDEQRLAFQELFTECATEQDAWWALGCGSDYPGNEHQVLTRAETQAIQETTQHFYASLSDYDLVRYLWAGCGICRGCHLEDTLLAFLIEEAATIADFAESCFMYNAGLCETDTRHDRAQSDLEKRREQAQRALDLQHDLEQDALDTRYAREEQELEERYTRERAALVDFIPGYKPAQ